VSFASTSSTGVYTALGLPTGTYFARTFASTGHVNRLYNGAPCGLGCQVTTGTPITVTAGATASGVDFALSAEGGRISGKVTNAAGQALSGVTVQFYSETGTSFASVSTNAEGVYTYSRALPPGTYFVRTFNSAGYLNKGYANLDCSITCTVTSGSPIRVSSTATTPASVDFFLLVGGRIAGAVSSGPSAPLPGISVSIYGSSGTFVASASTDGTGAYAISTGLPTGTYFARTSNSAGYFDQLYNNLDCATSCTVTSGSAISVTAGATASSLNFTLAPGGRIAGKITDGATGAPLSGVTVSVYSDAGAFLASTASTAGRAF